jgi:hypothetical protein
MTVEELLKRLVKPLVWDGNYAKDPLTPGSWWALQDGVFPEHIEKARHARIAVALDPAMLEKIAAMMEDEG